MIYVDPLVKWGGSKTFRWTTSCHMVGDAADELHAFAKHIGLKREWAQNGIILHYDLNESKRRLAVDRGAIELTMPQMAVRIRDARTKRMIDTRK